MAEDVRITISIRDPRAPHPVLGSIQAAAGGGLRYGFQLGSGSPLQLQVARADPNAAAIFRARNMVTIERTDALHPWVGFIERTRGNLSSGYFVLECVDFAGFLYGEDSRVAKGWPVQKAAAGELIRRIFAEANGRGDPHTLVSLPDSFGPVVEYQPEAEPIIDFLETMTQWTDWEWGLEYELSRQKLSARLLWQDRLGRNLAHSGGHEMIDGVHFVDAEYIESARGQLKSAVAIAGVGAIANRPAFSANRGATAEDGISGTSATDARGEGGSRVIINPQIRNLEAAEAAAKRQHHTPDFLGEQLVLQMWEGFAAPDELEPFPMDRLELGSLYRCRINDIAAGGSIDRTIRLLGYSLGVDGMIDCSVQVLAEGS